MVAVVERRLGLVGGRLRVAESELVDLLNDAVVAVYGGVAAGLAGRTGSAQRAGGELVGPEGGLSAEVRKGLRG